MIGQFSPTNFKGKEGILQYGQCRVTYRGQKASEIIMEGMSRVFKTCRGCLGKFEIHEV